MHGIQFLNVEFGTWNLFVNWFLMIICNLGFVIWKLTKGRSQAYPIIYSFAFTIIIPNSIPNSLSS